MRLFKFRYGSACQFAYSHLCQLRIGQRDIERVLPPLDQLHTKGKAFFTNEGADRIEQAFIILFTNASVQLRRQRVNIGREFKRAGIN